ncbi:MAG: hypothetical protein AAB268_07980 [Elusimicrobiota bacterium]
MSICEKALGGMWGLNLLAICAVNLSEIQHCLSVLILYAATYFLFAPLHVLILMCVWMAYGLERGDSPLSAGAAARAASHLFCVETMMFWALYWGMMLEVVPLHMRV